jgi:putative cardiolipin synthase
MSVSTLPKIWNVGGWLGVILLLLATPAVRGEALSGLHPLFNGSDALAARLSLIDQARRSIDAQYYIWKADVTGRLLIDRLCKAADRGVRVRVLLDDYGSAPDDVVWLALDAHPHLEVRLFNPVADRKLRGLSALLNFQRINRRMHNKTFTVDGRYTVIGGRNMADEYFDANPAMEFADLDVLAVGPVVREVGRSFEQYWDCRASRPISSVNGHRPSLPDQKSLRYALDAHAKDTVNSPMVRAVSQAAISRELRRGTVKCHQGRAHLLYDDPSKIDHSPAKTATHLTPHLRPVMAAASREVLLVTPYFIPGHDGVEFFAALRARGVRVAILTNSLSVLDMPAVYSAYQRYRKPLLRAGVELYEVRSTSPEMNPRSRRWRGRSAAASLHAKTFIFDRRTVFVGSLNLDPRSVELNTEVGVMFESPAFAAMIVDTMEHTFWRSAYRLELRPGVGPDRLLWTLPAEGGRVAATREPDTSWSLRARTDLLSLLPIESQL